MSNNKTVSIIKFNIMKTVFYNLSPSKISSIGFLLVCGFKNRQYLLCFKYHIILYEAYIYLLINPNRILLIMVSIELLSKLIKRTVVMTIPKLSLIVFFFSFVSYPTVKIEHIH